MSRSLSFFSDSLAPCLSIKKVYRGIMQHNLFNFFPNASVTFLQTGLINFVDKKQKHDFQYVSSCFMIDACFPYAISHTILNFHILWLVGSYSHVCQPSSSVLRSIVLYDYFCQPNLELVFKSNSALEFCRNCFPIGTLPT